MLKGRGSTRGARVRSADNIIELIDKPDKRGREAEEIGADAIDERCGNCVQRVDNFLSIFLRLELVLATARMTESFRLFMLN